MIYLMPCDVDIHCVAYVRYIQRNRRVLSYIRQLVIIGLCVKGGPATKHAATLHIQQERLLRLHSIGVLNDGHNAAANQAYTQGAH